MTTITVELGNFKIPGVKGAWGQFFLVNFPVRTCMIGLYRRKLPLFTELKSLILVAEILRIYSLKNR